jgi:hypothetical protein
MTILYIVEVTDEIIPALGKHSGQTVGIYKTEKLARQAIITYTNNGITEHTFLSETLINDRIIEQFYREDFTSFQVHKTFLIVPFELDKQFV